MFMASELVQGDGPCWRVTNVVAAVILSSSLKRGSL